MEDKSGKFSERSYLLDGIYRLYYKNRNLGRKFTYEGLHNICENVPVFLFYGLKGEKRI